MLSSNKPSNDKYHDAIDPYLDDISMLDHSKYPPTFYDDMTKPHKQHYKPLKQPKLSTLAFYSILALIPFLLAWWTLLWVLELAKSKVSILCSKILRER